MLPYALIPAVGALLAYTIYIRADDAFQPGVYAGSAVLTVLVVVSYPPRQWVLAHLEIAGNNRLDDPAVRGIILNSHDVTLRKQIEETLQRQAHHDPLTDLLNRVLLHQQLGQALREKGSLALLVMDLDHFKEINDTLGHHYGDLLLQQVSDRVRGVLRSSDTVARLGGDEFGLLLPGADAAGAPSVASAVRAVLDTPFSVEKQTLNPGDERSTEVTAASAPEPAQNVLREESRDLRPRSHGKPRADRGRMWYEGHISSRPIVR